MFTAQRHNGRADRARERGRYRRGERERGEAHLLLTQRKKIEERVGGCVTGKADKRKAKCFCACLKVLVTTPTFIVFRIS